MKRPFFLLEVLLALCLLTLSLLPFTSFPYKSYTKEMKALASMESFRLFDVMEVEVLKKIEEEIPFSAFHEDEPLILDLEKREILDQSYQALAKVHLAKSEEKGKVKLLRAELILEKKGQKFSQERKILIHS